MIFFLDHPGDAIHHGHPMDISVTKNFDEDESFMFQSVIFNSRNKKLIIQKNKNTAIIHTVIPNLSISHCDKRRTS
jgi:hypothetical protein